MELCIGSIKIKDWQACDAATIINARGKGYSPGCLRTLFETLKTNKVLFPNEASVESVDSMGSRNKGVI